MIKNHMPGSALQEEGVLAASVIILMTWTNLPVHVALHQSGFAPAAPGRRIVEDIGTFGRG